jgi:cerevisin
MHVSVLFSLLSFAIGTPLIQNPTDHVIANKYIVKLKDNVATLASTQLTDSLTMKPENHYSMNGFRGFAGHLSPEELTMLQNSDQVRAPVSTTAQKPPLTRPGRTHRARY